MKRVVLTDKLLKSLKPAPRGKRRVILDAIVPGLAVRVTDKGHKTFVLGARYPGSRNFVAREIAEVGAMTLADARNAARRWLELIKSGQDPREVVRRERAAAARAAGNTFAAVAERFISSDVQRKKRQAHVVEYRLRKEVIPFLGPRPIAEISRPEVANLLQRIADRGAPAFARNILDALRAVFNFALNRDYGLEHSPTDRIKPKDLLGEKQVRERVLSDDEIRAVWCGAERVGYPYGKIIQFLLLTGCRVSEVALARWKEFDLKRKLWTIPASRSKVKAGHLVPLTPHMLDLLSSLERWAAGDYLFTSNGSKPFNGFSTSKRLFDRHVEIEMEPWIRHDLRRTVRTRLAALRIPDNIAELVIGHAKKGLQRVYDQHHYLNEKREALEAWNVALAAIVNPPPDNVIPLKKLGV